MTNTLPARITMKLYHILQIILGLTWLFLLISCNNAQGYENNTHSGHNGADKGNPHNPEIDEHHEDDHDGEGEHKEGHSEEIRLTPEQMSEFGIQTTKIIFLRLDAPFELKGTVKINPSFEAHITSPLPGRITALDVSWGDNVQEGQLLATVENPELASLVAEYYEKTLQYGIKSKQLEKLQLSHTEIFQQNIAVLNQLQKNLQEQKNLMSSSITSQEGQVNAQLRQREEQVTQKKQLMQESIENLRHMIGEQKSYLQERQSLSNSGVIPKTVYRTESTEIMGQSIENRITINQMIMDLKTQEEELIRFRADTSIDLQKQSREGIIQVKNLEKDVHMVSYDMNVRSQELSKELISLEVELEELGNAKHTAEDRLRGSGLTDSDLNSIIEHSHHSHNRIPITAPFAGQIVSQEVSRGEVLTEDSPLFTLMDPSKMWVIVNAFEADMEKLSMGQKCTILISNELRLPGVVTYISPVLAKDSRTIQVGIIPQQPSDMLRDGMFVGVQLQEMTHQSLFVPEEALFHEENVPMLFLFEPEESAFRAIPVKVGSRAGSMVEILEGLEENDQIVSRGTVILKSESKKSELVDEHGH